MRRASGSADGTPEGTVGREGSALVKPPDPVASIGDEIAELAAHITVATYRLLTLLREFDERHGWANQGARSCAHWLHWRTGIDLGAAREKVRVARALKHLPLLSEAMRRGELSYSKVRALTRVATESTEAELLVFAQDGTTAHVERLVRGWRRLDRQQQIAESNERHLHRGAHWYHDDDGMLVLHARLDPEEGAVLVKALEAAEQTLFDEGPSKHEPPKQETVEQRRADALILVGESALGDGLEGTQRGDRYQVMVHVDAGALRDDSALADGVDRCELEEGPRVSAETSRRLACGGSRVVLHDGKPPGEVLDVGRRSRTIPPAIRRALHQRDRSCRFPGCTTRHCDAHHIRHWADGGHTRLDNLVLLCRKHHRMMHEEGFRLTRAQDGELCFSTPRGARIPDVPEPPPLPSRPIRSLYARHEEDGVEIGAWTGSSGWDGSPVGIDELNWALTWFRETAHQEMAARNVSAETSQGSFGV